MLSGGRGGYCSDEENDLNDIKADLTSSAESVDDKLVELFPFSSAPSSPSRTVSQRPNVEFTLLSVKERVSSLENLPGVSSAKFAVMSLKDDLKPLKASRASYKGKITMVLNGLKEYSDANSLDELSVNKQVTQVTNYLNKIEEIEQKMSDIWDRHSVDLEESSRSTDVLESVKHQQAVNLKLSQYEKAVMPSAPAPLQPPAAPDPAAAAAAAAVAAGVVNNKELVDAILKSQSSAGRNLIKCDRFDGGSSDKFEFKYWLSQFESMLASGRTMSGTSKLSALRNHLTHSGLAFKIISHFEINDDNYELAIQALTNEFLDKDYIIHEIFKQILEKFPKYDTEFENLRLYVAEMKSVLGDLKKSYQVDLLTPATGGYLFVSNIMFSKLPPVVKKALIEKVNSNYPTLDHIFDNIKDIIKKLDKTKPKKPENHKSDTGKDFRSSKTVSERRPALENFVTSANRGTKSYHCKLCENEGHTSFYCNIYKTREQRVERCKVLKLCFRCNSNKHITSTCPGKEGKLDSPCRQCNSRGHISAMCHKDISTSGAISKSFPDKVAAGITDVCFSTGVDESPQLLPIINLKLRGHNGQTCNFNFLFDTASQRSYLSQQALAYLGCNNKLISNVEFEVKTFLGSSKKKLSEVNLDVFVGSSKHYAMLMLIDDQFDISFDVRGLGQAVTNLKSNGHILAADLKTDSDLVTVHGLIGVDVIQFLKQVRMINCMNGSAWRVSKGIIPFGNVEHFLHSSQIESIKFSRKSVNNFNTLVSKYKCPSTFVNFVLEPKLSYDDPFESFFDDSLVERRVDKMLSCDSLGIEDNENSISDYDSEKIEKFKNSIELINGEYHVDLVWHDNVDKVPSNEGVALKVLDRVTQDLEKKGKLAEYIEGIHKWETDSIVERIEVSPKDFKNYVWIPHRPVFKTDEQSTTKMRPVFNCSLKTRKGPSLNEASYAGINLMKDMLELTMLFRTNHYVYLADVRKAFLMIKLKSIKDRNRFCFFLKEGDKLVCYRFTTIIFGFNASPFILNYVIKHHASSFPDDHCTDSLLNNFFVDNLVKSHNSEDELVQLYVNSVARMGQGNFDLRSCNTNSEKLKEIMIKDTRYVEHNCDFEKVLGYKYSPAKDVIKLADSKINLMPSLVSKRVILSQFSKVFDPLSLTSPVSIRGKILLSNIWKKKKSEDHWDEEVDEEDSRTWSAVSKDLAGLSTIEFPRFSLSEDEPTDVYLFCDASKNAYGYVAYAVQNGKSCNVLSKSKVAPLLTKSLPTLELLGVFLAFNGLFSILKTFSKVKINNIFVAVDAQVVLSWLLSDTVKTKNQFARNRIRDVHRMRDDLFNQFRIPISFKYVSTDQNPADLLTRGLTLEQFKQNLDFWIYGPKWIQSSNVVWPSHDLNCLSASNKSIVLSTCISNVKSLQPIVPFDRYSKLNKLIGVTSKMIESLSKFKILKDNHMNSLWGSSDPHKCAKIYLFKLMQSKCFPVELDYLKNPLNKQVPTLVSNLNLFLDEFGVLRSNGRSGKCSTFEYDLINPILLAKNHDLTKLIIRDCHMKCQHLGIGSTLTKVRMSGFWIPKARQAVKSVISSCYMCKRFNSLSFKYPKVTNLPKHRVNFVKPFKHTGIDYTGSIFVKDSKGFKKYYLLVFTCLNVRAVHIELVPDMNTFSLVLAIIRFTNIYGVPSHIYSDNAKSFIAGCDVMKEIFLASEFCEHYSKYNIKHIRIPAYSAWVGSTWERMIRVVKSCLYKVVGRSSMGYFRLLTVLSDIQNAVNSRPLTYRCSDDSSLEIITPNCFIKPYVNDNLLFLSNDDSILQSGPPTRQEVNKSLINRDKLLEEFRSLWYEEYLISLREQWKDLHEINFCNKVKVNDVVLVKGPPDKKRPYWHLGRVLELLPGSDGKVRSVRLKRADGDIAHHSLNHLYPMELALTHDHVAMAPDESYDQEISQNDLVLSDNQLRTDNTGENLVSPDDLESQVLVNPGITTGNIVADMHLEHVLPSSVTSVEDSVDQAESGADSYLVDDHVINHYSRIENLDNVHDQGLNLVEVTDLPSSNLVEVTDLPSSNLVEVVDLPLRRPRRAVTSRGRPLDDQFEYY